MAAEKKTGIPVDAKKVEKTVLTEAVKVGEKVAELKKLEEKAADLKKVEEKAAALKDETKKAVKKAAEVKEEAKKADDLAKKAADKAAEVKKTAEKAVADASKKTVEKAAAAAKKAAAPEASVTIEYQGRQYAAKSILEQATAAYMDAHKGSLLKTIEIYVKPEEGVAYYVANGEGSDDYKILL